MSSREKDLLQFNLTAEIPSFGKTPEPLFVISSYLLLHLMVSAPDSIAAQIDPQRCFFRQGQTRPLSARKAALKKLLLTIQDHEAEILAALHQDFSKPAFEGYVNEVLWVVREIKHVLKHLSQWVRPQRRWADLPLLPATAHIHPDPVGTVLIISPWNYPFYLCLMPFIGAIAAGDSIVLKPSEFAPNTATIVETLINQALPSGWVGVIQGEATVSQQLIAEPFDHIFFTGSPAVGKKIMAAAAKNLTPVTLELGGKSPCIVDGEINLQETVKRISWGKFVNAGQTCVAPDYLLVQQALLPEFLSALTTVTRDFFGEPGDLQTAYAHIINQHHWQRLVARLTEGEVIYGGLYQAAANYLSPTLILNPDLNAPLMQAEIFGPLLPILTYDTLDQAIAFVNKRPKPLALYYFGQNRQKQEQILAQTQSGGVCLNDTLMQLSASALPFGGVGQSGIGRYHGKASFDCFSHPKSVLKRPFWGETNLRYPPYGNKAKWIKRFFS